MPEKYIPIAEPLATKGLRPPILNALLPDGEIYSTLLFQHKGDIETSNTGADRFVRNQDRDLASRQFRSFFETAQNEEVDIALTPEYSCPWDVIDNLITSNLLPKSDKVWIVGCESIRPKELRSLREKHINSVVVIADDRIESTVADKFLDPVCIFFRTKELNSETEKNVLLIQFKTKSMAGDFELGSFIKGKQRYVLHNEGDNGIRLAVIICSDSSVLTLDANTFPQFDVYPYLLVHLQLNEKSKHTVFKSYRTRYFEKGKAEECHKELICLNWADGTRLPKGGTMVSLGSGGTAIYFKWPRVDVTDGRVVSNDNRGLFYNNWADGHTSVFNVVPTPGLFLFTSSKCSQSCAAGVDSPRSGPVMTGYFGWGNNAWENKGNPEIGLRSKVKRLLAEDFDEAILEQLLDSTLTFLDIERFLLLTNGEIVPSEKKQKDTSDAGNEKDKQKNKKAEPWTYAPNLRSLRIKPDEFSWRFTYLHDSDEDSADWKRGNYFSFVKVGRILAAKPEQVFTDERFSDFAKGCSLRFSPPRLNIVSSEGRTATLAYFDNLGEPAAKRNHATISTAIREETDDEVNLVVVYNKIDNTLSAVFPNPKKIDQNSRKEGPSILGRGGE